MKTNRWTQILIITLLSWGSAGAQQNLVELAEFQIKQGQYQEAINTISNHIELNPKDAKAFIIRSVAHGILGQMGQKQRDLEYARFLNPFAFMYIKPSERSRYYEKKQYEYDFERLSESFQKSPVKDQYYQLYLDDLIHAHAQDSIIVEAIYYLSTNDIENTETVLSQISVSQDIAGILYDLYGLVELKKNRIDSAIEYFSKSIQSMPDFPLPYHNRAIAYKLQGEYEKAKLDLDHAIGLNEDISVFYFTLAKLNERLENKEDALYYYEKALYKNPVYVEARTNYSLLRKTLGQYNESMIQLVDILNQSEDESKKHFINGGIHFTYGEYERAIREFDKYLLENKNDSDAIFNRGLAKVLYGLQAEGCEDIYLSIDLKPNPKRQQIRRAFCPSF